MVDLLDFIEKVARWIKNKSWPRRFLVFGRAEAKGWYSESVIQRTEHAAFR